MNSLTKSWNELPNETRNIYTFGASAVICHLGMLDNALSVLKKSGVENLLKSLDGSFYIWLLPSLVFDLAVIWAIVIKRRKQSTSSL